MSTNLSHRPLVVFTVDEKYHQIIADVLDKKQSANEVILRHTPQKLETLSANEWDIVILSATEFESLDFKLLDSQVSLSFIILYESNEEELAFSIIDQRIIDIIPVRAIHRLPSIIEREQRLRQISIPIQQNKQALRISESRYQMIVEDQSDLICRYTPDFTLIFTNKAYSQQYGKTPDEMIGVNLFDIIPETEWDIARAHIRSLTKENPVAISEHRSVMPDGTIRWQQWIDRVFFDADGQIMEYQGVGRDINNSKTIQEKLKFLHALTLKTSMANNLDEAFIETIQLICETHDWEYGEVWIPDYHQQVMKLGSPHFIHSAKIEQLQAFWQMAKTYQFVFGSGIPGRVWANQTSLWIVDVQQLSKSEFLRLDYARDTGIQGVVAIPIVDREEVLAVMIFMALRHLEPDEGLLELLNTALKQIAPIVRRQQMTDELMVSEEKYRSLVDNFNGVITISDVDGNYLFVNEKAWEPFNIHPHERVGKSVHDLFSPEIADLFVERVKEVIETGIPRSDIESMQTGGDDRWFNATIAPIKDPDGKIRRVQTIAFDVTEAKQAEIQLQQAQKIAHLGSWILNLNTNELFGSDEFLKICGLEGDGVHQTIEPNFPFVHPDDRERANEALAILRQTGKPYHIEIRVVQPNGNIRWVVSRGEISFNDRSIPLMVIGTFLDITERKQAELSLEGMLNRLNVFHTIEQSILRADTLEETSASAAKSISQLLPIHRVSIILINDQAKQARILATYTKASNTDFPTGTVMPMLDSELESLKQNQYLIVTGLDKDGTDAAEKLYREGVRSILSISLKQEDQLIGALNLHSTNEMFFEGNSLQIPLEIANQLAIAIRTRQLNEQIHKHNEELEANVKRRTTDLERLKIRTEAILASSTDAVLLLNEKMLVEQTNPALSTLLGCDSKSFLQDSIIQFIHNEDRDRFIQLMYHAKVNKSSNIAEVRVIRKSGEIRYTDISVELIFSSSFDSPHFVCSMHDITERKKVEDALRQSEVLYRALFEQSTDAVFILDLEGNHQYVNQQASLIFGYSPAEMVELSFRDLVHTSEHEKSQAVLQRLLSGEKISIYERKMKKRDGTVFPVEINVELVRDETGRPLHIQSLIRDISERKQAEIALRKSEEKYRALIETMHSGFAIYDMDDRFVYVNNQMCQILGYSSDELIGTLSLEYVDATSRQKVEDQINERKNEQKGDYEIVAIHKNGQPVNLLISASPLLDDEGHYIGSSAVVANITPLKQAQAMQEKLAQRLQLATEVGGIGIWNWEIASGYIIGDRQLHQIYDIEYGEFNHISIFESAIHPEDKAHVMAVLLATIEGEQDDYNLDFRIMLTNGSIRYIRAKGILQKDGDGKPERMIGVNYDITQIKEAHFELEKLTKRLQLATEIANIGVWEYNFTDNQLHIDKQSLQNYGFDSHDFDGDTANMETILSRYLHPDDHIRVAQKMANTIHENEPYNVEFRIVLPEQKIHYIKASAIVLRQSNGNPERMIGTNLDITSIRESQMALEMAHQRLQLATEAGRMGIWEWDIQTNRLAWDQQMYTLFGIDPQDTPQSLLDVWIGLLHPDDVARMLSENTEFEIAGTTFDSTFRILLRNKTIRHIRVRAIMSRDQNHNPLRAVGISWDITDERLASEALQRALEQERELSELKSRFVSMASHEFRTPLATISATTETLLAYRHRLDDEKLDARLHKILYQVAHMRVIMEDVLQLARIQAGHVIFNPLIDDLDALCCNIIKEFSEQSEYSGRIIYHCEQSPLYYNYDARLIRHMISNLISNALKYSPINQSVFVDLDADETSIVFKVHDKGIGIPEPDLKRLFEPFHRASNVGAISGTGLGLSITKEAVDLHGGNIQIDTELGIGTTFIVTLPTERKLTHVQDSGN